jgi:hypothetical protein
MPMKKPEGGLDVKRLPWAKSYKFGIGERCPDRRRGHRKFESVCEQLDRDGGSTVTREVSLARTRGVVVPGARRGQLYGSMFAFRFPLAVRVRERRVADP